MSLNRIPEPELMDLGEEVQAYAQADFSEVNQRFVEGLCELAAGRSSLVALDLGCGPGDITIRTANAHPSWRITAIDASRPMLDWASSAANAAGLAGRIAWTLGDAKVIPAPMAHFDLVFSNSLLHHISDAVAMWREVKRVTKPGGTIFFRDLYRPATEAGARQIVETHAGRESKLLKEEFHRSLLSAYSAAEVYAQLEQAGLRGFTVRELNDRHIDIIGTA